eukprot:239570_1
MKISNPCDAYVFDATFKRNVIWNMEQKCIRFETETVFARGLRRMVDGRDSLLTYFRADEIFIERWKQNYKLYTIHQQQFFFGCILAICVKIKYIDFEFENQCVLIP